MKHLTILLFLGCLITSYCSAQPPEEEGPPDRHRIKLPVRPTETDVAFISDDTCNLKINGKDYGKIFKNNPTTIKLPFGNHQLFFESLETGETINRRSFRLTRDSILAGKYIYTVRFNKPSN